MSSSAAGTDGAAVASGRGVHVVLITAPSADVAERMVRTLVEERHAACGNILPGLTSIYRWEGAVQTDTEALVILKTTAEALPGLMARVPQLHPYDVPEILALPIEAGHGPYLDWVCASSRVEGSEAR